MERAPIVVPIRFATGEMAVQTTTRELSEKGVLVRCLKPPPLGASLEVKLYLPGSRDPLQAAAVVREHARAEQDPGFWADFAQLYKAQFAVRFATVQDFVLEYAANISAGGVFVHTEQPPPLKTVVQVEMELPGSREPVPARGLVVHRVTKQDAEQMGTLPGVGVQFMDADDAFRQRIDAAISHILEAERAA